ncbi:MAG: MBL fold metallo-hydrolase, partial [Luteimonas sp.]|nr:MBL fold metallo-hydrolase [Luteimonas sp.]
MQFAESVREPDCCPVCEDERQYVGQGGQRWTTLEELRATHRNRIEAEADGLLGIGTEPAFAINERALLVRSPGGNLLWDCIALVDDDTVARVNAAGGIRAIAISHPHYYSGMVEWSRAFDGVPILLHSADRQWVMRDDPAIESWDGDTRALWDDMTLVRCGGHFAGGTVAYVPRLHDGRGALLTGDVIQVAMDNRHVGFMRSFPNYIPLSARAVRGIEAAVAPLAFDAIHGAWWGRSIPIDARAALARSVERYIAALEG